MEKYHMKFLETFYFASALCKVIPLKWGIPYTFKEFATMQQYTYFKTQCQPTRIIKRYESNCYK